MNHTNPTPDHTDTLVTIKRLAQRWLRVTKLRRAAHSAWNVVIDDRTPLYRTRHNEYNRLDNELLGIETTLVDLATEVGAVAPRHVRIGNLIVAVAPDAGDLEGNERVAVIDIRRPAAALPTSK